MPHNPLPPTLLYFFSIKGTAQCVLYPCAPAHSAALGRIVNPGKQALELLAHDIPAGVMEAYPVSTKVNRPTYDKADLLERIQ